MELNDVARETLSTIRIEGKMLKDYSSEEISSWGLRIGLCESDIQIYQQVIVELNK